MWLQSFSFICFGSWIKSCLTCNPRQGTLWRSHSPVLRRPSRLLCFRHIRSSPGATQRLTRWPLTVSVSLEGILWFWLRPGREGHWLCCTFIWKLAHKQNKSQTQLELELWKQAALENEPCLQRFTEMSHILAPIYIISVCMLTCICTCVYIRKVEI